MADVYQLDSKHGSEEYDDKEAAEIRRDLLEIDAEVHKIKNLKARIRKKKKGEALPPEDEVVEA